RIVVARGTVEPILRGQMAEGGNCWIRSEEDHCIGKIAAVLGSGRVDSVVSADDVGDMRDGLLILRRPPAEIAAGERFLHQVGGIGELAVKMEKRRHG